MRPVNLEAAHIPYYAEIDGLRAIAVSAVVLYHADLTPMTGGFVGVDVFFVISGFLIGGLLWAEIQATGDIALRSFWMRRLRRLAPAFLLMSFTALGVGYLLLLPFELRELGKEIIAATVWLSNVLFWKSAGYFDAVASEKPMLHTWSLSVEEQFYLSLPILLLLVTRFTRRKWVLLAILASTWAGSLTATLALTSSRPDAVFFLFPFRSWELLTGVLLAVLRPTCSVKVRSSLGWVGLTLITASALFVQPEAFPGWQVLLPVMGTAMVLLSIGRTPFGPGKLLAHPALVFLGRISYGLYLWHWPVLVYAAYWRGEMTGAERAGWLLLSVLVATLSWRYIETPARRPPAKGGVSSHLLLSGLCVTALATAAVGYIFYKSDGLHSRYSGDVLAHVSASGEFIQDDSRCGIPNDGPFAGVDFCRIGPDEPPQVLVWGDSHLRALMDGLADAAYSTSTPGLIVWRAGCPPLLGIAKRESSATPAEDAACTNTTARVLDSIEASNSLKLVILVGRWSYYAEGVGVGRDNDNTITLSRLPGSGFLSDSQAALYAESVEATVDALRKLDLQVAIVRQVPEIPYYDSRVVSRELAHGQLDEVTVRPLLEVQPRAAEDRSRVAEAPFWKLATAGDVMLIDPWPLLCTSVCDVMKQGQVLYFDNNHLNNFGAHFLSPLFVDLFRSKNFAGRLAMPEGASVR